MKSTTEAGYVKNLVHFKTLIELVIKMGTTYKPSQSALQISSLEALLEDAKAKLQEVEEASIAYFNKVHERQNTFADIRQLSSRLVNCIANTSAPEQTLNAAKALSRKLYGRRVATSAPRPLDPNTKAPRTISSRQQSFDKQIQHISAIVGILKTIPSYHPNEPELQVTTLETRVADLMRLNDDVASVYASVNMARIERNKILFAPENSIHAVAMAVKRYIKTIYNVKSQEYRQIISLRFYSMRNI